MSKYLFSISLLASLLLLGSCDLYPQDDYQEYYVVESYLVANRTLPTVRVSTTLPVDEEYQFSKVAVNDANVEVRLLNEAGEVTKTFPYFHSDDGLYATNSPHTVLSERRYQLHVSFSSSSDEVTATTFVPGQFESNKDAVADSIAYQDPKQVVIKTSRSFYPGRQSYFIFTVKALNPTKDNLTDFYADILSEQDDEEDIQNFYNNSSGIINEDNYDQEQDSLTLRLPWLSVAFYGDNYVISNAIDNNMYDFFRTQDIQGGGSTLPPGELQNVIYHVEGGIGVFGSIATDTVKVYVGRKE